MLGRHRGLKRASLFAVNPGTHATRVLRLTKPESSLGSEEADDLVVRDSSVSRRHALIRWHRGKWQIVDDGSTNGTYVGEQKVDAWTTLRDGADVRFGGARFVFRSEGAPSARSTSDFVVRKRGSRLRTIMVLTAACLVGGFAAMQFFLYRSYENALRPAPTTRSSPKLGGVRGSPSRLNAASAGSFSWLERVNHWRELTGLAAVSAGLKLSSAAEDHSRYLVKHALEGRIDATAAGGAHTEEPTDPWYTPAGLAAAQNGDVDPPCRGCSLSSASQQIDGFVAVPFHRLAILDPLIRKMGYGSYTQDGLQAAVLYLPTPTSSGTTFKRPIEFPPNGSIVGFAAYEPEWPDPLSTCPSYTAPAGIPITLELGRWMVPEVSAYSLKDGSKRLQICVFNASTYNNPSGAAQMRGRNILKGYGTVVLIPRQPLASGQTYVVSISANGKVYSWSFSVK